MTDAFTRATPTYRRAIALGNPQHDAFQVFPRRSWLSRIGWMGLQGGVVLLFVLVVCAAVIGFAGER